MSDPFGDKINWAVAQLEIALSHLEKMQWQPMSTAPKDGTVVNVMGRYPDASAGHPRYAGYYEGQWFQYSRHDPEPLICWAWRPRDPHETWPQESNPPKITGGE